MTAAKGLTAYKFVGRHLDDLADGRVLEPGQVCKLDKTAEEHPHNQRLITEGLLIPTKHDKED
jgi:hypothetical protein